MAAQGYVVDSMVVSLDTDGTGVGAPVQVECGITGIVWNTNDEQVTWQVACPDGYGAGTVKGAQTLDVSFVVDYRDGSLSRLLDANHGKVATVKWTPDPVNAPNYHLGGEVTLQRGSWTHQVGSAATGSATFPVSGAGITKVT
jgi:hypothetical protein